MFDRRSIIMAACASVLARAANATPQPGSNYEPGWWDARKQVYEWRLLNVQPQRATATFAQFLEMDRVLRSLSEDPATAAARAKALTEKMEHAKREYPQGNTNLFPGQRFDIMGYGHPRGVRGQAMLATNALLTASLAGVNTRGWVVYEHWRGGGAEAMEWDICGNTGINGVGASLPCRRDPSFGDPP